MRTLRAEGFDIVPLDEVPSRLAAPGAKPFAALTFDDGYRDNVQHAAPVLRRHAAPWTLFVTTDFVEGRGRLWWLELERAIARLERVGLTVGGEALDLPSRTAAEKRKLSRQSIGACAPGRKTFCSPPSPGWRRARGGVPEEMVRSLCLGWDEIAELARDPAVAVGAHTVTHPMLAKHDEARARREIADSKAIVEAKLGRPVRHLAYPVGDPTSAGPREFRLAREAGFATAVTTRPGHVFPAHAQHLHALPRISVNGLFQSEAALKSLVSGVPFLAVNRGRRVNVT